MRKTIQASVDLLTPEKLGRLPTSGLIALFFGNIITLRALAEGDPRRVGAEHAQFALAAELDQRIPPRLNDSISAPSADPS